MGADQIMVRVQFALRPNNPPPLQRQRRPQQQLQRQRPPRCQRKSMSGICMEKPTASKVQKSQQKRSAGRRLLSSRVPLGLRLIMQGIPMAASYLNQLKSFTGIQIAADQIMVRVQFALRPNNPPRQLPLRVQLLPLVVTLMNLHPRAGRSDLVNSIVTFR